MRLVWLVVLLGISSVSALALPPGFVIAYQNCFNDTIRPRSNWSAVPAKTWDMDRDADKGGIVLHHSAGWNHSHPQAVLDIQTLHMRTNGWSDIGYHFVIGAGGQIYEGRDLNYQGAHAKGFNQGTIGVCMLGCFDSRECHAPDYPEVHQVNQTMLVSVARLVGALAEHYGIDLNSETLRGHQGCPHAHTSCPGDGIMTRLTNLLYQSIAAKNRMQACRGFHDEL